MIADGVWLPRDRRLPRAHQPRRRRPCLGELVQIDGCDQRPETPSWRDLAEWTAKLDAIAPDRDAGQAWIDARRDALAAHVAAADERYAALRPEARRMATLTIEDGVAR